MVHSKLAYRALYVFQVLCSMLQPRLFKVLQSPGPHLIMEKHIQRNSLLQQSYYRITNVTCQMLWIVHMKTAVL